MSTVAINLRELDSVRISVKSRPLVISGAEFVLSGIDEFWEARATDPRYLEDEARGFILNPCKVKMQHSDTGLAEEIAGTGKAAHGLLERINWLIFTARRLGIDIILEATPSLMGGSSLEQPSGSPKEEAK